MQENYVNPSDEHADQAICRFCESKLHYMLVDMGMSPLCESYISLEAANRMEPFFPLKVYICGNCFLAQLEEYVSPQEIFSEYAYYSSYSDSWLEHARCYTDMIVAKLGLGAKSKIMEVASNDGYLLQYFLRKGIKAIGVEPAANVAAEAERKGVPTVIKFFNRETALELHDRYGRMDLIIGNNILAQVPELNDFVSALRIVLKPDGVITLEFHHLMRLMSGNQFDTIYHEHFSYFSFMAVEKIFVHHGFALFDVDELSTHGGSLRVYAQFDDYEGRTTSERVVEMRRREHDAGLDRMETYGTFANNAMEAKRKLLEFLIGAKREGKSVVGYGAPGKGNTLLNYCGIRTDFIDYTVDRNPYKQGKLLPGTRIPIFHPDKIFETRPDYVMVLPWNFKEEIMAQMAAIRTWGGKFVVPLPQTQVLP